jgi:hypothetical protein
MRGNARSNGIALGLVVLALLALLIPYIALKLIVIAAIAAGLLAAVLLR